MEINERGPGPSPDCCWAAPPQASWRRSPCRHSGWKDRVSREAATGVHLQRQPLARLAPQQGIGLFCPLLSSVTYGPSAFSLHTPCPPPQRMLLAQAAS